jgi:hypothetical protein
MIVNEETGTGDYADVWMTAAAHTAHAHQQMCDVMTAAAHTACAHQQMCDVMTAAAHTACAHQQMCDVMTAAAHTARAHHNVHTSAAFPIKMTFLPFFSPSFSFLFFFQFDGAGEVVQLLKVPVLLEDLGSIPSTHIVSHDHS